MKKKKDLVEVTLRPNFLSWEFARRPTRIPFFVLCLQTLDIPLQHI